MANNANNLSFKKSLNIGRIESIERLVSQIVEHITDLQGVTGGQKALKVLALKGLAKWQTIELCELRRAFEE